MRVRHRLAAICATSVIMVVAGTPAIADDGIASVDGTTTIASAEPADTPTEPADTPAVPADAPVEPADAPTEPAAVPAEQTEPPAEPANAPTTPTQVPAESTETPAEPEAAVEPAVAAADSTPPAPDHLVVQDVRIESIQVGVANTGDNLSTSDEPAAVSNGTPATNLDTGSAAAVGSSDSTTIGQQVVTDLRDGATAEIVQISIVFNIGGALANSGDNALAAGSGASGGGTIDTGSASAVGNSADTYVTQGASGRAAPGEIDEVNQRTATLQIGFALANSGSNVISATLTTGGPATASTGNATAIGNLSSTTIDQVVRATGSGDASLRIEQRATVVNLGIAFAGTGENLIGADFSAALMRGDEAALEHLLGLVLPVLFASADDPIGAGSGEISTGDATSIGNRSNTRVLQVAVGEADSGSVGIRQDVVVVNAGIASATTGGNSIGGSTDTRRALAPGAESVVGQLTSFVRQLVADIEAWASGTGSGLGSHALDTAFGGFDIGIDRSFVASTADGSATSVTTRQLAAVINLAVARANSGGNRAEVAIGESELVSAFMDPDVTAALAESGTAAVLIAGTERPLLIVTGDASATNTSVLVVCQRADLLELDCLGPDSDEESLPPVAPPTVTPPMATPPAASPPTVEPPAATSTATPAATQPPADPAARIGTPTAPPPEARSLPASGTDSGRLVLAALTLLLFGCSLLIVSRQQT